MGPHIWDSSAQTCLLVSLPFFLLPFLLPSLPLPSLLSPTPAPPLVAQCTSAGQIQWPSAGSWPATRVWYARPAAGGKVYYLIAGWCTSFNQASGYAQTLWPGAVSDVHPHRAVAHAKRCMHGEVGQNDPCVNPAN